MRVLVASGRIGSLSATDAGAAIARGWSEADPGAQLAVVPLGEAGEGFDEAASALLDAEISLLPGESAPDASALVPSLARSADCLLVSLAGAAQIAGWNPQASSIAVGRVLDRALRFDGPPPRRLLLDLGRFVAHDGGAGILAGLGAVADRPLDAGAPALAGIERVDIGELRRRLDGIRIELVVPAAEAARQLLGLRGITSLRGREAHVEPATLLAVDAALEQFATALSRAGGDVAAVAAPGSGAAGAAYALLALGAQVRTGSEVLAELAGLAATLPLADLIVAGCTTFDFASRGGGAVASIARWGADSLTPVVLLAGTVLIGAREMRTLGVESAYSVYPAAPGLPPDVTADQLAALAARVARSWGG